MAQIAVPEIADWCAVDILEDDGTLKRLADVWDALLSDRSYRPAWPEGEVVAHIREQAGVHFDPEIVEIFLEMMDVESNHPES